ncbi:P-type conjugative transfer protein TrbL [Acidithiobacillus ferrivorans]|nr:P-type conjugative transfer protein TrbL [Acidithiobacillus ferrivorans]
MFTKYMPTILLLLVVGLMWSGIADATPITLGLLTPYQAQSQQWFSVVQPLARDLWMTLFGVEIAWFGAKRVLFKVDIHSLIPALVKTLLFAAIGLAFIQHGATWFHDIVASFADVGARAAHIPTNITPGTIMSDGLNVAASLVNGMGTIGKTMASKSLLGSLVGNPGVMILGGLFGILIMLAFIVVTAEFIVIQVMSYILFGVGIIMLGFSAFRPVASFGEKYFSAAISVGVRMMILYVIVGIGMGVAQTWPQEITQSPTFDTALLVLGQAAIFGYLAVKIPSLAASLLQGSLNTGGGELLATAVGAGMALAGGAAVAGEAARGAANPVIAAARAGEAMGETGGTFMGTAARAPGAGGPPQSKMPTGSGFGASSPNIGSAATPSSGAGPKPSSGGTGGSNPLPPPGNPNNIQPKFADSGPQNDKRNRAGSRGAEGITALHHATSGVNSAVDKTPTQGMSPKFDASRDE